MFTTTLAGDKADRQRDMTFVSASKVKLRCKSWSPELPVARLDQSAVQRWGSALFSARHTPSPLHTRFLQALNELFGMEKERERDDGVKESKQKLSRIQGYTDIETQDCTDIET